MNQNQKEIKPFTRIDALSETLTRNIEIIQKQIFFIIDFQICYKTDEYTIPIEISIKPFLGLRIPDVIESFHQILNQQIPIQFYLNSKHYSDFEHGITPQNNPTSAASTDFVYLWKQMNQYIRNIMVKYSDPACSPILLTTPFKSSLQCIEYLAAQAKIDDVRKTIFNNIYSVDDFIECMNRFKDPNAYRNTNSIYSFYERMIFYEPSEEYKCDFHKGKKELRSFCCSKANCVHLEQSLSILLNTTIPKIINPNGMNMMQQQMTSPAHQMQNGMNNYEQYNQMNGMPPIGMNNQMNGPMNGMPSIGMNHMQDNNPYY